MGLRRRVGEGVWEWGLEADVGRQLRRAGARLNGRYGIATRLIDMAMPARSSG